MAEGFSLEVMHQAAIAMSIGTGQSRAWVDMGITLRKRGSEAIVSHDSAR